MAQINHKPTNLSGEVEKALTSRVPAVGLDLYLHPVEHLADECRKTHLAAACAHSDLFLRPALQITGAAADN